MKKWNAIGDADETGVAAGPEEVKQYSRYQADKLNKNSL
jgi:hypothetical protein